jgi:hypothetical protein
VERRPSPGKEEKKEGTGIRERPDKNVDEKKYRDIKKPKREDDRDDYGRGFGGRTGERRDE